MCITQPTPSFKSAICSVHRTYLGLRDAWRCDFEAIVKRKTGEMCKIEILQFELYISKRNYFYIFGLNKLLTKLIYAH